MDFTRRELAASALALAVARPLRAAVPKMLDVIVLGAGISGLNAAWLCEQQGLTTLTLEGRNRVGGRIYTLFDEPGTPEMGFNSMAAGYGRGIDAAKRAGVELYDVSPRYLKDPRQQLVIGSTPLSREQWAVFPGNPLPDAMKSMMPWEVVFALYAKHNPLKDWADWNVPTSAALDVPMHDFLAGQGLNEAAIKLVFDTAPYYGTTSRDAASLTYAFNDGWIKAQATAGKGSFAVRGGNQKLPMAMRGLLKGDVLLNKAVAAIHSDATGVTVICRDGSRHRARRVVSSLPFAALRHITIEPRLTGPQAQAVASLPYQPLSIAFLRVTAPFWGSDPVSMWTDGPLGAVLAQRYGTTDDEVTGLAVFARGQLAQRWDAMGKASALAMIVAELERLRPAAQGKVIGAALHSWALEPFNGGDWAYFHSGQISAFAATMALPAGRLHFCGEHTATANRGIEAALESSERVALEILSA